MLRDASLDVAVHLKDRLRDMRDFLRTQRRGLLAERPPQRPPFQMEALLGHAVGVVDDTLTLAESVSRAVLPGRQDGEPAVWPLTAYFTPDPIRGERAFRRHMYRTAKALAATVEDGAAPPIRETTFAAAHAALRRRHGHTLVTLASAAPEARPRVAAVLLAALLQEMCAQALDHDDFGSTALSGARRDAGEAPVPAVAGRRAACIRCFAPGLLASGLALSNDLPAADLFEIAGLAVAARSERMAAALRADRSIADLAGLFESLLMHLP
ncbi:hypothetical protein [Nitratireductor sp. ZSWI3]|uniref:hypothetical protein n=1 Tax=Nitratireductor sp. ZSWI3 TaxID=2966359 RepID=UPI00214FB0C6|nr:hypothetical protein [Nitratireductor sp. ZSWI3]MCR4267999.1 hypothetical protein [Nitratireductor sp. ZSWI3]